MVYTKDSMVKSVDWITIAIYLVLVVLGWTSICGASYDYGDMDFFSMDTRAGKQMLWRRQVIPVIMFILPMSILENTGNLKQMETVMPMP